MEHGRSRGSAGDIATEVSRIAALREVIDPLRTAAAAARTVRGATAAAILTRGGDVRPLPGLPGHPALSARSPVLAAVREQLDGPYASFLLPAPAAPDALVRVTALEVPPAQRSHDPLDLSAIVVLSPCGDLLGLTHRELEVLGLMVAGQRNAEAAQGLGVSARTVATHVEHVLTKLDAGTRALAAVRAQRRGLFIPAQLSVLGVHPLR